MIEKVIDSYEMQIERLRRLVELGQTIYAERPEYSIASLKETFRSLCAFFNCIKEKCGDFCPTMRKPYEYEIEEYDDQLGYPLIAMIDYRNDVIPVYDDDSGQQYFCIVERKESHGGAYNTDPTHIFCRFYDQVHDYNILFKDVKNESKIVQK